MEVDEGNRMNHVDRRSYKGQSKIVYNCIKLLGWTDYCVPSLSLHMRICILVCNKLFSTKISVDSVRSQSARTHLILTIGDKCGIRQTKEESELPW